ncbi:AI-2E family transporter [Alphaproteobacteria bacterium]|nr:AI-2E family transporter [Alphaproteobacteria bacterium]
MPAHFNNAKSKKAIVITVFLATLLAVIYSMGQWLIPFIIAMILAYALHAPVRTISTKLKISQALAASIFIIALIALFSFFAIFMIPLIKNAFIVLLSKLPKLMEFIPGFINSILRKIFFSIGIERTFNIENEMEKYVGLLTAGLPMFFLNFINHGIAIAYIVMFIFMTPILTFYLLKDWNKIENYIEILLKKTSSNLAATIITNINKKLGEYIKGQLIICVILSILYSVGIYFIGTNEFLTCGIFSGFLSFAPFFGPFLGFMTAITMSIDDFSTTFQYTLLAILYVAIPFLDSNFITPKLIGKKTGIPPFWILFSICATASILGTIGIFISVPMTVVLSTTCKELIKKV